MSITARSFGPYIGAEVYTTDFAAEAASVLPAGVNVSSEAGNVDLSSQESISDADFQDILDLVHKHTVLVFRNQWLSPAELVAFSRRFGDLEVHPLREFCVEDNPEILMVSNKHKDGKPIGLYEGGAIEWHVDQAPTPAPSAYVFLYCVEAAADGGDTLFAAADAAYDALPEDAKGRIDNLRAVHSMSFFLEQLRQGTPDQTLIFQPTLK